MNKRLANILLLIFKSSYFIIPVGILYFLIHPWFIFELTTIKMCAVLFVCLFIFSHIYNAFDVKSFAFSKLLSAQIIVLAFSYITIQFTLWVNDRNYLNFKETSIFFLLTLVLYILITKLLLHFKVRYIGKKKTIVIAGNCVKENLLKQLSRVNSTYDILKTFDNSTDWNTIESALKNIDCIIIDEISNEIKNKVLNFGFINRKQIIVVPTIEDIMIKTSYDLNEIDSPFLVISNYGPRIYERIIKRSIDFLGSLILTIIVSPIMLIVAVAIKSYDKGPALYSQTRLTLDGKTFKVYKFRSMIVNAEKNGAQLAKEHDDRITPIGKVIRKYRLDELPQLFNILKGDMSFVGPRPERPEIAAKYEEELPQFKYRLNVKAGLTGYAQVYGRYNTTPKDKLKLDLFYISKFSLLLDLELLLKTFQILFEKESTEGF